MSDESITFDPVGTVTVVFDDQTYRLGRPKMGQWRYFQRKLNEMAEHAQARSNELRALAEEAEGEDQKRLEAEAREFARRPFYEWTVGWVAEVFIQLGSKPLPDDVDDWPAWLAADVQLPTQIIVHWRTVPKASGSPPAT